MVSVVALGIIDSLSWHPQNIAVGVDTRSGAGLAHGGPCGDPLHGYSREIGPSCPASQARVPRCRSPCGHRTNASRCSRLAPYSYAPKAMTLARDCPKSTKPPIWRPRGRKTECQRPPSTKNAQSDGQPGAAERGDQTFPNLFKVGPKPCPFTLAQISRPEFR